MLNVIQNQDEKIELRYSAIKALWSESDIRVSRLDYSQSDKAISLLTKALQGSDLGIRQQAAIALIRTGKGILNSERAVDLFRIGLSSEDPTLRFDAITGLQEVCPLNRSDEPYSPCLYAKVALPSLINTLKDKSKPLRYNAALAIVKIDRKEEAAINVLSEILLEETDDEILAHARRTLGQIGSQQSILALAKIDDRRPYHKLSLYCESCHLGSPSVAVSREVINENLSYYSDFTKWISILTKWTPILENTSKSAKQSPALESVLRLKNQNLRRDIVHTLGGIDKTLYSQGFNKKKSTIKGKYNQNFNTN